MKTIYLILLLSFMAFGQATRVYYPSVLDSGDTEGTAVKLSKGLILAGVVTPDSLSDSLWFKVSLDGTTYYNLVQTDTTLYMVTPRIESAGAFALDTKKTFPFLYWIPVVSDTARETKTIQLLGQEL